MNLFEFYVDGKKIGYGNGYVRDIKIDDGYKHRKSEDLIFNKTFSGTLSDVKINPLAFGQLFGLKIIENVHMVDQIQVKTHKKKRINKKWRKRYGLRNVPKKEVYMLNQNTIVGHPTTIAKLNKLR